MKVPLWLRNPIGRRTKSRTRGLPRRKRRWPRLLLELLEERPAPGTTAKRGRSPDGLNVRVMQTSRRLAIGNGGEQDKRTAPFC
jgi:hypothetical protein